MKGHCFFCWSSLDINCERTEWVSEWDLIMWSEVRWGEWSLLIFKGNKINNFNIFPYIIYSSTAWFPSSNGTKDTIMIPKLHQLVLYRQPEGLYSLENSVCDARVTKLTPHIYVDAIKHISYYHSNKNILVRKCTLAIYLQSRVHTGRIYINTCHAKTENISYSYVEFQTVSLGSYFADFCESRTLQKTG